MKTVRDLLRDADPLRHEPAVLARERDRIRHAVIAAASDVATPSSAWFGRRNVLAATMVVLVGGIVTVGFELWSRGGTTLQAAAVRFEVRLAEDRPAAGLREVRIPGSDRVIYLHQEAILTNEDIAQSNVMEGNAPSRFWVAVQFTAAGAQKMRKATANHIGRPLAILIDGELVMAPVLRDPISTAATISGDYTRAEAERIVNGMMIR